MFNGPHPETGEELTVEDEMPEGFAPMDLPPQPAVFAPDYAPEEIAAIASAPARGRGTRQGADRRRRQSQAQAREQEQGEGEEARLIRGAL